MEAKARPSTEIEPSGRDSSPSPSFQDVWKWLVRHRNHFLITAALEVAGRVARRPYPPPQGYEGLEYVWPFLCIIVVGVLYSSREDIAQAVSDLRWWVRVLPVAVTMLLSAFAVVLTVGYLGGHSTPGTIQALTYVLVLPLYAAALATLVLILVCQDRPTLVIRGLLASLTSKRGEIVQLLRRLVSIESWGQRNAAFGAITSLVLNEEFEKIDRLSHGQAERDPGQWLNIHSLLVAHCNDFVGFSNQDLDFWLPRADDEPATEYFRAGADAVGKVKMTRLHIVGPSDLDPSSRLEQVLKLHLLAGIAFGVVYFDGLLPVHLRNLPESDLDFGIWDFGKVVTVYRGAQRGWKRKLEVSFTGGDQKLSLLLQVLPHAWLVSDTFKTNLVDQIKKIDNSLQQVRHQLERRVPPSFKLGTEFPIEVSGIEGLKQAVSDFVKLARMTSQSPTKAARKRVVEFRRGDNEQAK
jgi:hypothetical protein